MDGEDRKGGWRGVGFLDGEEYSLWPRKVVELNLRI